MARHYVADIRSIQPHGPYFLGGGSMGGLVAFEMAQQLLKVNEPVSMLLMLDSACPKLLKNIPDKKIHNSNLFAQVWHSIKCRIRDTFKYAKCARYQLLRIPIPHELRYWRITQKNLALAGQYLPEPYSRLITMFRAKQNNTCSNPYRGWQSVAKGGMEFFDFNCPHTTMTEDSEVGKKVGEVLNKNIKWHIPTTA
jgi:thioesterase domain-containing protein